MIGDPWISAFPLLLTLSLVTNFLLSVSVQYFKIPYAGVINQ